MTDEGGHEDGEANRWSTEWTDFTEVPAAEEN